MTSCAEPETALLQGPFIGTAVRSCLATPGKYLPGFVSWQLPKKKKKCQQRIRARELPPPACCSGCGQRTGNACLGMKDAFCSPALPHGSRLWEPVRASFPGSIADARAHTREREHSGACVRAHACPPARLLPAACPQAAHLYVPGARQKRGSQPHRGLATSRRSETPAGAAWALPATWAGLVKDTTSVCKLPPRLSRDRLS